MGVCTGKNFPLERALPKRRFSEGSDCFQTTLSGLPKTDIRRHFRFSAVIGKGSFGTVREAYRLSPPSSRPYAIKSVSKQRLEDNILRRELDIMQSVRHPNIVRCHAVFEDSHNIHIVMDHCTGGDLFHRLQSQHISTEAQLKPIFQQICSAVDYLHGIHVCHRDMKMEHVLFASEDTDSEVKLIDFGLARRYWGEQLVSFVGSPYYMAPEVVVGGYGVECDVWAVGVMLYLVLFGRPPFQGEDKEDVFRSTLKGNLNLNSDSVSQSAKSLLQGMLTTEVTKRLTMAEALAHEWFANTECRRNGGVRQKEEEWVSRRRSVEVR